MSEQKNRCTRCVLSKAFPRLEFDAQGVCSYCRDLAFYSPNDSAIEKAQAQVSDLFSQRMAGGTYDALVCLSGGKDSTYTLMLTVRKYGLRPLAFTFDNGFLSESAFENIRCAVNELAVDHVTIRPSVATMKSIIRASALHRIYAPRTLLRISAVCNSCITMVNTLAVTLALEKSIPFVIAGFTLGQIPTNAIVYRPNYRFIQESREMALKALARYAGEEVGSYFTIREDLLGLVPPWHVNLLCLEPISEEEIIREVSLIGWKPPGDVDGCSSNCRLNAFNNIAHEMALGYNPYELELSHLVRRGLLTREQALRKLDEKAGTQFEAVMSELGISHQELEEATTRLGPVCADRKEDAGGGMRQQDENG